MRRDSLRFVPFLRFRRWKLVVDEEKPYVWHCVERHPWIPQGWWKRTKFKKERI